MAKCELLKQQDTIDKIDLQMNRLKKQKEQEVNKDVCFKCVSIELIEEIKKLLKEKDYGYKLEKIEFGAPYDGLNSGKNVLTVKGAQQFIKNHNMDFKVALNIRFVGKKADKEKYKYYTDNKDHQSIHIAFQFDKDMKLNNNKKLEEYTDTELMYEDLSGCYGTKFKFDQEVVNHLPLTIRKDDIHQTGAVKKLFMDAIRNINKEHIKQTKQIEKLHEEYVCAKTQEM